MSIFRSEPFSATKISASLAQALHESPRACAARLVAACSSVESLTIHCRRGGRSGPRFFDPFGLPMMSYTSVPGRAPSADGAEEDQSLARMSPRTA
jgi:hypothetical protein